MSIRISVALCTYEPGKYLCEQLTSINNQTLKPFEIVICDDSSTNAVETFLKNFESIVPIRYYKNPKKLGVIKNFEKAITLCTGDYISTSDQDDVWRKDKLERLTLELSHVSSPGVAYSRVNIVDENLNLIKSKNNIIGRVPTFLFEILVRNFAPGCSMLLNRKLIEIAVPVHKVALMHDWWFLLHAFLYGQVVHIDEPLVSYRQHESNLIGASADKLQTKPSEILGLFKKYPEG